MVSYELALTSCMCAFYFSGTELAHSVLPITFFPGANNPCGVHFLRNNDCERMYRCNPGCFTFPELLRLITSFVEWLSLSLIRFGL